MSHVHHWIIEAANGATSPGVCRVCGLEKEFSNSPPDGGLSDWSKIHAGKDNREDGGDFHPGGNRVMGSVPS